jgi:hypothetical protein
VTRAVSRRRPKEAPQGLRQSITLEFLVPTPGQGKGNLGAMLRRALEAIPLACVALINDRGLRSSMPITVPLKLPWPDKPNKNLLRD